MPDAARKWLESYEKCLVKYRDTPPKQFRGRTPSTYDAVAHLRRLLEDNERLNKTLDKVDEISKRLEIKINNMGIRANLMIKTASQLKADRSAQVAYARRWKEGCSGFDPDLWDEWQALSDELKEEIDAA